MLSFLNRLFFLLVSLVWSAAGSDVTSVNLAQETQEITCQQVEEGKSSVVIEKRDGAFHFQGRRYELEEFYEEAFRARSSSAPESESYGHIQVFPGNNAALVVGKGWALEERNCSSRGTHKVCSFGGRDLRWGPERFVFEGDTYSVVRYGVYKSDGTYFLAQSGSKGLVLVDFGYKLFVVQGAYKTLSCFYSED